MASMADGGSQVPSRFTRARTWGESAICLLAGIVGLLLAAADSAHAADEAVRYGAPGDQQYWVEQIAEGLSFPSSMAWLPNGDMLIAERVGGLRRLRKGRLEAEAVSGTPAIFYEQSGGGDTDGLREIALDPDYASNRTIYLFLAEGTPEEHHAAVYRARYSAAGLTDVERIFRSQAGTAGMIARAMLLLADKTLLLAIAGSTTQSQSLETESGKTLRINRDGSIPADNPFVNKPGALPVIWTYGHRNQTGLYQDPETGRVWELEPGVRGGDELNLLQAGGNYGWPDVSWSFQYHNKGLVADRQTSAGMQDPVLLWTPSVTPSGITRYRGKVYPKWNGDFFIGHLSGRELERVRIEDRRVVLQERLLMPLKERIRNVKVGPDNHIYVLTDSKEGRLLRLQPGRPRGSQLARVAYKQKNPWHYQKAGIDLATLQPGDPVKGQQAFRERCAGCHSVGTVIHGGEIGPDLAGVYGRRSGSLPGYTYSQTMSSSNHVWDFASLNQFIADPDAFVQETTMAAAPLADPEVVRQIVGFLKQQSGQ